MSLPQTTISTGSWVLVTGATGFVAGHVTRQLLQRGYKVRGTVRDQSKAQWLIDDYFKSYAKSGSYELVTVPDISAAGAFDDAVKGVSAIAHIARAIDFDPNPNNVIPQTISGVTSILESASKESSVMRFVFTSSMVAAVLLTADQDGIIDHNSWNEFAVKEAWAPPPYEASRAMLVYAATYYVDVQDIALIHVAAILDPEVKDARLQTWGHNAHCNDFLAILRELRPQRKFIPDFPKAFYLKFSTDQSESIALLKKWAGQDNWKPLREIIPETINSPHWKTK
ncbi:hypothetical protein ACLX1H_003071 [Fusarium chlamydosporum]